MGLDVPVRVMGEKPLDRTERRPQIKVVDFTKLQSKPHAHFTRTKNHKLNGTRLEEGGSHPVICLDENSANSSDNLENELNEPFSILWHALCCRTKYCKKYTKRFYQNYHKLSKDSFDG